MSQQQLQQRPPAAPAQPAKRPATLYDLVNSEDAKSQLAIALPKHLDASRFTRIVLTELRKTPALLQCTPQSFTAAVIQAAQLGLELGSGLGYAYLIPYKDTCQLIIGYKGLIDLARRSGSLAKIAAYVVYEHDFFDYELGDDEKILHKPGMGDRGKPVAVYAIAKLTNGEVQREVMSVHQVEVIRQRAKRPNPVWGTDWEEMARKTVIRRICKILPLSPEMRDAIDVEAHDYEEEPQRLRPARFAEISAAPDMPLAQDNAAELQEARATLRQAFASFQGDPVACTGGTLEEWCAVDQVERVWHAVDLLAAGSEEGERP